MGSTIIVNVAEEAVAEELLPDEVDCKGD